MERVHEIKVGKEAVAYVRQRLNEGHTLAQKVLSLLDFASGCARACVPEAETCVGFTDFEHGGVWPNGRKALEWYIDIIQEYLSGAGERMCVLENWPARSSDPCFTSFESPTVTFGEEVYHVLWAEESDRGKIEKAILEAASAWVSLGFMTSSPPGWDPRSRRFSSQELEHLAAKTEKVAIDAYDREGWLIWGKA